MSGRELKMMTAYFSRKKVQRWASGTGRRTQAPVSCCSALLGTGLLTTQSMALELQPKFPPSSQQEVEEEEGMEGPW